MTKNIIILKIIKILFVLIFFLLFSCSSNQKYSENDISEIIKTTLKEFSIESNSNTTMKLSIEFAPRLDRNTSDKKFLENNFERIILANNKLNIAPKEDIDFMLKNKKCLSKKKLSDYINCFDKCIYTDKYFKGEQNFFKDFNSFIRITRPYISINNDFAIIGYGSYNKFEDGMGYFLLSKEKNTWKVLKKVNMF